ncbi:hypothetical protein PIIN_00304 [Serendipita indica DSM 11827]|uniref:Mediator of RNA polymerase II transcription subunit 20 n=1 Tax=Serendipita indica (strain DSM 11827) TaxID=1109443 RepID=G4T5N0_SERID|nr:hypothetical protein PIIN_00304 [Serendipita indica DSM 11827]
MGVRGIARWSNAPSTGVQLISDSVSRQHGARPSGSWQAEIRAIRRHTYVDGVTSVGGERLLWEYTNAGDQVLTIIEDPTAPKRADYMAARAEAMQANAAKQQAGLEVAELPPLPPHFRHTLISYRQASIEALLDQLGGAWNLQQQKPTDLGMMGRPTGGTTHRLRIEGRVWNIGSDWIVRVGGVFAIGEQFKGVIMEIEYLPVDVLPQDDGSSVFLDQFTASLIPSQLPSEANFNSVVIADKEWAHVCGIDIASGSSPADEDIYVYGDEEQTAEDPSHKDDWRRSAYMIVLAFHGEGIA